MSLHEIKKYLARNTGARKKLFAVRIAASVLCAGIVFGLFPLQTAASNAKVVRVGYYSEDDSYMRGGDDAAPKSGYAYDYLQKIASYTGWRYQYVYSDWSDLLNKLENGQVDLLFNVSYTKERAQKMLFAQAAAGKESNYLYTRAENQTIGSADYDGLNGKAIGVYRADIGEQYMQLIAWLKKYHIQCDVIQYDSSSERNAALENGILDAIVATDAHTDKSWRPIAAIGSSDYYFAVTENRKDLLHDLDDAQARILAESPYYNEELQQKYFSYSVIQQYLTDDEKAWIKQHNQVKVGYVNHYAPYCDTDQSTGAIMGVASTVMDQIGNAYGIHFIAHAYSTYSALYKDFESGKIEVMIPISGDYWLAEQQNYKVTADIADSPMSVVSGDVDMTHLYDCIAVTEDAPLQMPYVKTNFPNAKILKCADMKDCLKAVAEGKASCTVIGNTYLQMQLKNDSELRKLNVSEAKYDMKVTFAVHEDGLTLLSILNKGIASVGEEALENSFLKYSLQSNKVTFIDMIKDDRLAVMLLIAVFLIFSFSIVFLSINRKHLIEARLAADKANTAKGQFLSRMSHEIRTPMNAIVGLTAIAHHHEKEPEKVNDYLNKIDSSSKVLLSLINDVLDMSAIESGKLKIASIKFDLKTVLNGISAVYYAQCEQKGVVFSMAADLNCEYFVGDSLRINQILLNLISNAYKFTEAGGHIDVLVTQTENQDKTAVSFMVSDTGCGMSQEMLERLFKPFEQESADTARRHGGSGLGLSITKNLVEMMHGTLRVESEQGKGSRFIVELPLQKADAPKEAVRGKLKTLRALVVDDEQYAREYTGTILDRIGLPYDLANSGQQALQLIVKAEQKKKAYQICFLDWKMPDMDGIEVTRKIRSMCGDEALIIIVSAYDVSEVEDAAREAGANLFISKPLFQSTVFDLLLSISGSSAAVKKQQGTEHYDFTGHRVLVAEDNEINREVARGLLEYVHMQADFAGDGKEAIELFSSHPAGTYDAVLMDVQMPVMDGHEAAKAIRALERPDGKTIPIYAMTADAFAEDVGAALASGMDGHIAKPIEPKILYEKLQEAISKAK